MKSVVHVIGNLDRDIGGPRTSLSILLKEGDTDVNREHSVICKFESETEFNEFKRETKTKVRWIQSTIFAFFYYWIALKEFKSKSTEMIVHIHGLFGLYAIVALIFSRAFTSKCIISPRGMTLRVSGWGFKVYAKNLVIKLVNRMLAANGLIHATSEQELELCSQQFSNCRIVRVSNVPSRNKIIKKPVFRSYGRNLITYIGRISRSKGVDFLIDAWLSLSPEQKHDYKLMLVGPFDDIFKYSEKRVRQFSELGLILRDPEYKTEKKAEFLTRTRFLVNFSRSENFGHSTFEALQFGVPVVTSVATPWHEVESLGAGFVFDPDSVDYSRLLERCLACDDKRLLEMSAAAEMFVSSYLSANRNDMFSIYDATNA